MESIRKNMARRRDRDRKLEHWWGHCQGSEKVMPKTGGLDIDYLIAVLYWGDPPGFWFFGLLTMCQKVGRRGDGRAFLLLCFL